MSGFVNKYSSLKNSNRIRARVMVKVSVLG